MLQIAELGKAAPPTHLQVERAKSQQDQCFHGSRPNCEVDGVGGLGAQRHVTPIRKAPRQPLSVENPRRRVDQGEGSFGPLPL